jgi:hypothetical protein
MLAQRMQGIAQLKPEIDGLRTRVSALGEMLQGRQRLLQVRHCLSVGRACTRLDTRLSAIGQGLLPHLTPECMVRETFNVFAAPLGIEHFQRLHDPRVEAAPPLVREIPVGDLLGEGMLESVLDLGKEAGLIEELSGLQVSEAVPDLLLRLLGDGLQEAQGTSLPMTAAAWSRRFASTDSRSMRAARIACTVTGTCRLQSGFARR